MGHDEDVRARRAEANRLVQECAGRPDDAQLWLRTGLMLDSLGREKTAIPHYEHALQVGLSNSDERVALICLASSYRNTKDFDAALRVIGKARHRYPNDPAVESFYALIKFSAGDAPGAIRTLGAILLKSVPAEAFDGFDEALKSKFRGITAKSRSGS